MPTRPGEALPADYPRFLEEVKRAVSTARSRAALAVSAAVLAAYWEIGRRIVAREQGGQARAGYGQALIARLAEDLTRRFGRGFGKANLASMRAFYFAWPAAEIFQTVSGKSAAPENVQTPSGKSLGRTFTPRAPVSRARSTNCLPRSTCLRRSPASGEWNSQVVPKLTSRTLARSKRCRTCVRSTGPSDGSTPCRWPVRSSTPAKPAVSSIAMTVSRS